MINVTSIAGAIDRLGTLMADCVAVCETRATKVDQTMVDSRLRATGRSVCWSLPTGQYLAAGPKGSTGGVALIATRAWTMQPRQLPLELEVEPHNYLAAQLASKELTASYTVIVYYGHPTFKQRTMRDLQRIEEFVTIHKEPLVLLSDTNIADEDVELTPDSIHLQDAALVAMRTEMQELEATHDGPFRRSRIDRIFVSEQLAKAQIHFQLLKHIHFAGHSPIRLDLSRKLPLVLVHTAQPPICRGKLTHNPQYLPVVYQEVETALQDPTMDAHQVLEVWQNRWRAYLQLCNGQQTTPPLQESKPRLERLLVANEKVPKTLARLANFLHDLRRLHDHAEPGHACNAAAWARVKRASVAMALKYGIPDVMNQKFDEDSVVKEMLRLTYDHYKTICDTELRHQREHKLQTAKLHLNANHGINARVSRILQGKLAKIPIAVKEHDRVYTSYATMLQLIYKAWSKYFDQTFSNSITDWERQYVKNIPRIRCSTPLLEAHHLRQVLTKANDHATAGPDHWYTADLRELPDPALQQLAEIFNRIEKMGSFPSSMLRSWTSMIPKSPEPQSPTSLRPIAVLSALYRLYASARQSTLSAWFAEVCPEEILSYLPGRSTTDAALYISTRVETVRQRREEGSFEELHILSLDASKAFPSVDRRQLWSVLQAAGAPAWLPQLIEGAYKQATTRFRVEGKYVHTEHDL